MVTPPAFNAAIPVGATTINRLCVLSRRLLRKVVFPVPAFPVRKTCCEVELIKSAARVDMLSVSFVALVLKCENKEKLR